MIQKNFELDLRNEPELIKINFTNENKEDFFCLNIFCENLEYSSNLKGDLIAFRRIYEVGNSERQKFTIDLEEGRNLVRITGDISNAVYILQEKGIISERLYKEIYSNPEIKGFLEDSKKVLLSEKKTNSTIMQKATERPSQLSFFGKKSDQVEAEKKGTSGQNQGIQPNVKTDTDEEKLNKIRKLLYSDGEVLNYLQQNPSLLEKIVLEFQQKLVIGK